MKKIILITLLLFLCTTVLHLLLTTIINEQIISRIVYGVDMDTYLTEYYSGNNGVINLLSGEKVPYEWVFTLFNYLIGIGCVFNLFFVVKKLNTKYEVDKKEFKKIMIGFSILSLYNVIIYIVMFLNIPPIDLFILPVLFIVFTYISIKKIMIES